MRSLRLLSESGRLLLLTSLLLIVAACANWAQDEYDYYRSLPAVTAQQTASPDGAGAVDSAYMALVRMQFNNADFAKNPGLKTTVPWTSTANSDSASGSGLRYDTTGYGSGPNMQLPQMPGIPSSMNGLGAQGTLGVGSNGMRVGSTPMGSSSILRGSDTSYTGLDSSASTTSSSSGW